MKILLVSVLLIYFGMTAHAQIQVKLGYLSDYVGDSVTVCGKVESARYMKAADDSITVINVGGKYPDQLLTIVIWRQHRSQFAGSPEIDWIGKQVCVTGKVEIYNKKPEIVVKQTSQVQIQE